MSVCYASGLLEGCTMGESRLCREFAQTFVRCAAGVIYAAKPVALFSFAPSAEGCGREGDGEGLRASLHELVRVYGRELRAFGIGLERLSVRGRRVTLLAYREELVAELLDNDEDRAFLREHGYGTEGVSALLDSMRRRLAEYYEAPGSGRARPAFPHEIGLLFGYPLEDVIGFINGARFTCRGPWKAYGDVEQARLRFDALSRVEGECRRRYRSGATLARLLASA
jgi:hypothetical protein